MPATLQSSTSNDLHLRLQALRENASRVILDKQREVDLALCCLIAGGHLLIEDIPGVGKTTLVKTLASLLDLGSARIQFTNDLLPADILGSSIFDSEKRAFVFHRGPIFAQLVLADELNRATPKTQSACLQAMEERRVTIDGITHQLPEPFFVVATQNPRQQIGTFPLPESQLDRFLMRLQLGYPSREAEKKLLLGESRLDLVEDLQACAAPSDLASMREAAQKVHVSDSIVNYVQDLVARSRDRLQLAGASAASRAVSSGTARGLSPRGALALMSASRAWAFMQKRAMILPEDVQAVASAVMSHRLNPTDDLTGETGTRIVQDILSAVRVD